MIIVELLQEILSKQISVYTLVVIFTMILIIRKIAYVVNTKIYYDAYSIAIKEEKVSQDALIEMRKIQIEREKENAFPKSFYDKAHRIALKQFLDDKKIKV